MTQLCAMDGSSLRWADNVLRQLNRGLLLVEGLSFEVDEFRAWVETQKPYFASHPKTRVKGWASFEEMEAWHDDFKAQRIGELRADPVPACDGMRVGLTRRLSFLVQLT